MTGRRVGETVEQVLVGEGYGMLYRRGYTDWVLNLPSRITGGEPVVRYGIDDAAAGYFEFVLVGDRQVARRIDRC